MVGQTIVSRWQWAGGNVRRRVVYAIVATVAASSASAGGAQVQTAGDCLPTILSIAGAGALTDQSSRALMSGRFAGRTVVLTMVPTDCEATCALRVLDLDQVARALPVPQRQRFAFVIVHTGSAGPAALQRLARTWRLAPDRWTIIGGEDHAMNRLRRQLDVFPDTVTTSSNVVLLFDANGALRQRYDGDPLDRARIAREAGVIDHIAHAKPLSPCLSNPIRG